jgi:hypothetical protein
LTEALIATSVLLLLFSAATNGLNQTVTFSRTTTNRAKCTVRSRCDRVDAAGESARPGASRCPVRSALAGAVVKGTAQTVALTTARACSPARNVVIGTGMLGETVTITGIAGTSITGNFTVDHAAGEPLQIYGGFGTGCGAADADEWLDGHRAQAVRRHQRRRSDAVRRVHVRRRHNSLYRNVMAWNAAPSRA